LAKKRSGTRSKRPGRYWLLKSEPTSYSIDDLAAEPRQTTCWDGIRNYQARNFLRDEFHVGDRAFFYHSSTQPMAIVGTVEVISTAYPDSTAFDPDDHHYDSKSDPDNPTWMMVDVKLLQRFPEPVTRDVLRACDDLKEMMLLKRGSRLSVQPVTPQEWKAVHRLAGVKDV